MKVERRQHPRTASDWTVKIQNNEILYDGTVQNVSHEGALIYCGRQLLPNERLRITIEHSDRETQVIDAKVIRSFTLSQDETTFKYGMGIRFANICDDKQPTTAAVLSSAKSCPRCKSTARYRIRRKIWMRIIPASRFYNCQDCDCNYVSVLRLLSFRWGAGIRN